MITDTRCSTHLDIVFVMLTVLVQLNAMTDYCTRAHFAKNLFRAIQIRWKLCFGVIQLLVIKSQLFQATSRHGVCRIVPSYWCFENCSVCCQGIIWTADTAAIGATVAYEILFAFAFFCKALSTLKISPVWWGLSSVIVRLALWKLYVMYMNVMSNSMPSNFLQYNS